MQIFSREPYFLRADYIEAGIVELFEASALITNISNQMETQAFHMNEAVQFAKGNYDWIMILDSDEFVVPMKKNTLQKVLEEYQEFAGVSVQWICFGTSNIEEIPSNKLMIELLTYRGAYDWHFNGAEKWIVRPECIEKMSTVHHPIFKNDFFGVYDNKTKALPPPKGWRVDPIHGPENIRINHYWSRDEDYFNKIKIPRQAKWNNYCLKELLECRTLLNTYPDNSMERFILPLRERVFGKK